MKLRKQIEGKKKDSGNNLISVYMHFGESDDDDGNQTIHNQVPGLKLGV